MAATYATLAQLKSRMDIDDTTDDAILASVLDAISRAIDNVTGRRFFTTASDETRYYTRRDGGGDTFFCPDDIISVTTLATDDDGDRTYDESWASTDYDLMPYNAALDDKPYTWLEVTPNGDYTFPNTRKGIKIVGKFGYSIEPPPAITEACLVLAEKLFKRKDMPFGTGGAASLGELTTNMIQAIRDDAEVKFLLSSYERKV